MPFSLEERTALLALKGVGPTVITRLEQLGIDSLEVLGKSNVSDILAQASAAVGSTCWKNSPQARAAITAAVALARATKPPMPTTRSGTILSGEHTGWTITIQDDTAGETGGYYLYLADEQLNGFDAWFESMEPLEREISELEVRWD